MAKISLYDSEWFFNILPRSFEGFAEDSLEKSAKVLEQSMKSTARAKIKHEGESDLVNSIKASKVVKKPDGTYIVNVGPRGYSNHTYYAKDGHGQRTKRKYKVSNALKAIWMEYGVKGRPARPFIQKSTNDVEEQVLKIIQDEFNKQVKQ